MNDWLELDFVRVANPDGDYVRISGQPHRLQYRTREPGCAADEPWGPWRVAGVRNPLTEVST